MANEKNLIPFNKRTESEQREYARQGGVKSGEVRRQRKAMREQMELLLSLPFKDQKQIEFMQNLGIETDNIDNQMALLVSLYATAIKGGQNSVQAFKAIQEVVEGKQENKNNNESLAEAIQKAYEQRVGDE